MDYFKNRFSIESSLPPPSLPPPMLPPDALNVLLNGPKLPPRPNKMVSSIFKLINNVLFNCKSPCDKSNLYHRNANFYHHIV